MAKRKNQYEITEAVDYFLREAGIHDEYLVNRAIVNWEEIAGSPIAAHTDDIWFREGILHVKMKNAVWRQEVWMLRQELKNKIHDFLGTEVISEVRIYAS